MLLFYGSVQEAFGLDVGLMLPRFTMKHSAADKVEKECVGY